MAVSIVKTSNRKLMPEIKNGEYPDFSNDRLREIKMLKDLTH